MNIIFWGGMKDRAFEVVKDLAYIHKKKIKDLDSFLQHSYSAGQMAEEVARELGLDFEELAAAGCLHDIGRCLTKDKKEHTFHEIIGARYVEERGVELGITDSQEQCNRIAQSFRSHFVVYEQFRMGEYSQWLPGLNDTNPVLLLPKSWNELIIVYADFYADLIDVNVKEVNFWERIADIKEKDRKLGNLRLEAIKKAEKRLFDLNENLESALQAGKINGKYCLL